MFHIDSGGLMVNGKISPLSEFSAEELREQLVKEEESIKKVSAQIEKLQVELVVSQSNIALIKTELPKRPKPLPDIDMNVIIDLTTNQKINPANLSRSQLDALEKQNLIFAASLKAELKKMESSVIEYNNISDDLKKSLPPLMKKVMEANVESYEIKQMSLKMTESNLRNIAKAKGEYNAPSKHGQFGNIEVINEANGGRTINFTFG